MSAVSKLPNQIKSTAGAVPVMNEKGELTMQKVKVTRYVSGRRPEYAPEDDSDSELSDEEEREFAPEANEVRWVETAEEEGAADVVKDRRLQRLRERQATISERRERAIDDPELIFDAEAQKEEEEEEVTSRKLPTHFIQPSDSESEDEELDDDAIERRRALMREKAHRKAMEEDILDVAEEEQSAHEESSEYEEYSDSEDETGPRLKPVFVRKMDRVTIRERQAHEKEEEAVQKELKRQEELRKRESHKLVAQAVASELQKEQGAASVDKVVNTDDENEEEEYEAWKVRELKRIKRDRETTEKEQQDKEETDKLHSMTEEERRAYLRTQPKVITNQAAKGKYKFLQKYYHRGAFFLDEEQTVFTRDVAQPTLEDHFDKTVLPKVMQVKNFGRAGRTKYTHLVDQDTTEFDSAWTATNPINVKFENKGGGTKQVFERPLHKKRKIG